MRNEFFQIKISDPINKDFELYKRETLSYYLDLPTSHWTSGSGDSALRKDDFDGLMFFKYDTSLYFVMEISSYLSPVQNQNNSKWLAHQIGGEPFFFSSNYLCSKEVLLKILIEYAISGKKHNDFDWTDPIPSEELFFELLKEK